QFLPNDGSVPLRQYFAFMTAVTILDIHIGSLSTHSDIRTCPFDNNPSINVLEMMRRGALCNICQKNLETAVTRGEVDPDLVTSMNRVFEFIAAELDGPKKESFTRVPDHEQEVANQSEQPETNEFSAKFGGPVEWGSGVKAEAAFPIEHSQSSEETPESGKFEVDLYCEVLVPPDRPPPSAVVAEFINRLGTNIVVNDCGRAEVVFEGTAPFSNERLSHFTVGPTSDNPAIYLSSKVLTEPFFVSEQHAVISAFSELPRGNIDVNLAYIYLLAVALMAQQKRVIDDTWNVPSELWGQGDTLEQLVADAYFPVETFGMLKDEPKRESSIVPFIDSISTIVSAVSKEYYRRKKVVEPEPPAVSGNRPAAAITEQARPIDALNYRVYANAFGDLITHPDTGTPLTIGICAPWGRGKTVLLNYIQERIEKKVIGSTDCQCIEFNAWQYTKAEQLWAAFYSTILDKVESTFGFWQKWKFRLHVSWHAYGWPLVLWPLLIISVVGGVVISIEYVEYWWGPVGGAIPFVSFLWTVLRRVSKNVITQPIRPMHQATASVRKEVFRRIGIVRKWFEKNYHGRVVVFIDDIDRCSPDKIMQMLESIKLLLDTENFVFVLAMDARVVRLAIGQHYRFMARKPVEREEMGRYYLEKIIQIPFAVPPANPDELVHMKNQLFKELQQVPEVDAREAAAQKGTIEPDAAPADAGPPRSVPAAEGEPVKSDREPVPDAAVSEPVDPGHYVPRGGEVDPNKEMSITPAESANLEKLLLENLDLSPRLLTRVNNVYRIAKRLYQTERKKQPPPALMQWIALSAKFPFATKAVIEICEKGNWEADWQQVFSDLMSLTPQNLNDRTFSDAGLDQLHRFLSDNIDAPKTVKEFIKYANCFNLVLD
ncbi:MAG: P-loop NTPase fold protein, partial [bacterium]